MNISVVLPNYNHADKLPRALNALLSQRLQPIEIIVVDDCSTDESVEIVRQFEQRSKLIKLVQHSKNRGAPAALNTGLSLATGELVYFAAADDFTLPELFLTAANAFRKYPDAAFFCSQVAIISPQGGILGFRPVFPPSLRSTYLPPAAVRREFKISDNWAVGPSVIYRRHRLIEAGGFDETLGSFCDGLVIRLLAFQYGFFFSSDIQGAWEFYPDSYSSRSALSPANTLRQISTATAKVRVLFPKDVSDSYAKLLDRRMRFNVARLFLLWGGTRPDIDSIVIISHLRKYDRLLLDRLAAVPKIGSLAIVAWLALRLRPFGPIALLRGLCAIVLRSFLRWKHFKTQKEFIHRLSQTDQL